MANAESASDNTQQRRNWDEVFAQVLPDQKKVSITRQIDWLDDSALGYARSARSDAAAVRWLPQQPLPAVDGINGKIAGWGGGEKGDNGFYGGEASLSIPLAQQWGLQIDGGAGSDQGIGNYDVDAQLFWRDPSIGLLGAFVRYAHDNGVNDPIFGHISENILKYGVEGEYYMNRWTIHSHVGVETTRISSNAALFTLSGLNAPSVPNRVFDDVLVSYYVTDNFRLSVGHDLIFGTHFLRLGSEYGFELGGGRMAAVFTDGWIGEGGNNGALAGLRIYFGQRDKTLIRRHREDDPSLFSPEARWVLESQIAVLTTCINHTTSTSALCNQIRTAHGLPALPLTP
jgi:hypothetical protein